MGVNVMSKDLTRRYVEEIFDVTGLARRGMKRLDDIRNMSENEFNAFIEDIEAHFFGYYQRNLEKISGALRRYRRQSKAFYYGSAVPLVTPRSIQGGRSIAPFGSFLRKAALYHDKIIVEDPFLGSLFYMDSYTTEGLKNNIVLEMAGLLTLQPWLEAGLVQPVPSLTIMDESFRDRISGFADEDYDDEEWASSKGALKNEDIGLDGEDLIRTLEGLIKAAIDRSILDESGGVRAVALKALLSGTSLTVGKGFFGAALTGSLPTTDMSCMWRLFGLWASKRAKLLVERGELRREVWEWMKSGVKANRAWHQLRVEKLGALMKLSPNEIIKIRESSKYSLASFRRTLVRAVEEIEMAKLGDEEEIQDVASQAWRNVQEEADAVQRDLKYLKTKTGLAAGFTPLVFALGLLPFPIPLLASSLLAGGSLAGIATRYLLERKRHEERSGYFLLKLREA